MNAICFVGSISQHKYYKECNFMQKAEREEEHGVDETAGEDPVSFEAELKRLSGKEREKALK
jgi:hypothetical protein